MVQLRKLSPGERPFGFNKILGLASRLHDYPVSSNPKIRIYWDSEIPRWYVAWEKERAMEDSKN